MSAALQDHDTEIDDELADDPDLGFGDGPDWVVAYRLIWGIALGSEPTKDEIRLAVWHLIDRGYSRGEIMARTGLSKPVVVAVAETRRVARRPVPADDLRARRRAQAAAAKRPCWYDLNMLGAV